MLFNIKTILSLSKNVECFVDVYLEGSETTATREHKLINVAALWSSQALYADC